MPNDRPPLPRTLKLSRRPLFNFAFVLSPLLVFAAIRFARHGPRPEILFLAVIPIVLYGAIIAIVLSQRTTVNRDAIETTTLLRFHRRIPFATITRTEIQIPAGLDRPICAHIHTTDPENPIITLSLKAIAPDDAAWLSSLPELKPTPPRHKSI